MATVSVFLPSSHFTPTFLSPVLSVSLFLPAHEGVAQEACRLLVHPDYVTVTRTVGAGGDVVGVEGSVSLLGCGLRWR